MQKLNTYSFILFAFLVSTEAFAKTKPDPKVATKLKAALKNVQPRIEAHKETSLAIQKACQRLQTTGKYAGEFEKDHIQVKEHFRTVKEVESVFEPLKDCETRNQTAHENFLRTESSVKKIEKDSEEKFRAFATASTTCKTKERAEELRTDYEKMTEKIKKLINTAKDSAEVHRGQIELFNAITNAKPLPGQIDPALAEFREFLKRTKSGQKAVRKELESVLALEKKFDDEKKTLESKYQELLKSFSENSDEAETILAPLQAAQESQEECRKSEATDFLEDSDKSIAQTNEWIQHSLRLKPAIATILKCKPIMDTAALERIKKVPTEMNARLDPSQGKIDVKRCLATATFYDEVSATLEERKKVLKRAQDMKLKEEDDASRASRVPTLRKEKESKK